MKKTLLTVSLLVTLGAVGYAESPQSQSKITQKAPEKLEKSLLKALDAYKEAVMTKDANKSIALLYDGIYKAIPKEQLVASIKNQTAKEEMRGTVVKSFTAKPQLPVKSFKDGYFTMVDYSLGMQMDMSKAGSTEENKAILNDPKKLEEMKGFMTKIYKSMYGDNVKLSFEPNSLKMNLDIDASMVAIDENNSGWKFIELSVQSAKMLDKVLPKEIQDTYKDKIEALKKKAEKMMEEMMKAMTGQAGK